MVGWNTINSIWKIKREACLRHRLKEKETSPAQRTYLLLHCYEHLLNLEHASIASLLKLLDTGDSSQFSQGLITSDLPDY